MKTPKVAIVISSYNQEKLLEKCLLSLINKTNYKSYKIFLVDDSGAGKIGKNIQKKFKKIKIIINKKNLGFSGANNKGLKYALENYNPDYFLLLNDDTEIIQKDWLEKMIEVGESNKKIGILGCKILNPDSTIQNLGGYIKNWKITVELNEKKEVFEVDHVMGAFLLIKKQVIEKIGFLDENLNPYLLEDTDYCLRAKKENFELLSVPFVSIIHKKGKSIDSKNLPERIKVRLKNDIYFSKKHLKGFSCFFRIYVYLLFFSLFEKKKNEKGLIITNFKLRKNFIDNIKLYLKSLKNVE